MLRDFQKIQVAHAPVMGTLGARATRANGGLQRLSRHLCMAGRV